MYHLWENRMSTPKDISAPTKVALREIESGRSLTKPRNRLESLELSRRLISRKSKDVVEAVLRIALDEAHPKQIDALKLLVNRIAPQAFYDKLADKQAGKGGVNVQINVVNGAVDTTPMVEVIDIQPTEVRNESV
jgi:hypothetical protein